MASERVNCWTVVVSNSFAKADWWDFRTQKEALRFANELLRDDRSLGNSGRLRIITKHNPAFERCDVHDDCRANRQLAEACLAHSRKLVRRARWTKRRAQRRRSLLAQLDAVRARRAR